MNTVSQSGTEQLPLIFLVDDNPEFINGLELTLEMEGFEVKTALNGQEALDRLLAIFRSQMEDDTGTVRLPDLILSDIMMPVMDGYEFYDRTRKNPYLNHIPFIFLTAKGETEDIRLGKELGSDDYLPKLTPTEDTLATIRGKLKRVNQRRAIAERFTWDSNESLEGRGIILIAIITTLVGLAFCAGYGAAIFFAG